MLEIIINDQIACICLPELVNLFVQALVPNLGPKYKIEVKEHGVKEDAK